MFHRCEKVLVLGFSDFLSPCITLLIFGWSTRYLANCWWAAVIILKSSGFLLSGLPETPLLFSVLLIVESSTLALANIRETFSCCQVPWGCFMTSDYSILSTWTELFLSHSWMGNNHPFICSQSVGLWIDVQTLHRYFELLKSNEKQHTFFVFFK